MKTPLILSSIVLYAVLGTTVVYAEEPVKAEEKGLAGSMIDAVKNTAGDVKRAVVGDKKATPASPVAEDEKTELANDSEEADAEPAAPVAPTAPPAPASTESTTKVPVETLIDDAKDAEAERKVSATSLAIYSQNPYIQSIMTKTKHIKAARLKEIIANGDAVTMLDVRPRSEFAKTKGIAGVELNIPRNFLEVEAYEKLPAKDASIIVISSKGIRGGLAAHTLQEMGYSNVRNLMDGLEGWYKVE